MNTDKEISGNQTHKNSLNGASVARTGEKAVNALKEKDIVASDALEMATERFNDILARGQELSKVGAETVRKYPLYSVLGVASVAFFAGYLLRRK